MSLNKVKIAIIGLGRIARTRIDPIDHSLNYANLLLWLI